MCGIVLMGAKFTAGIRDVEFFEQLLFADTFRGPHSTGVMSVFKNEGVNAGIHTVIRKAALTGPEFLATKLWDEVSTEKKPGVAINTFTITRPNIMVGHNRWATRGEINAVNAHPFRHGHISLVHNGTLTDQTLLPDHKSYEVDSANICYAIAKDGAAATIQKLDGAYTLIWIDENENTLNIIRNKERPFHLVELSTGDYFGASEEAMLMWILQRGKTAPTIKRHFECEVGVQYVFDITNGNFTFKEEIKHELPTFHKTYSYTGSSSYYRGGIYDYDDDYDYTGRGRTTPVYETYQEKQTRWKKELEEAGLTKTVGDFITFNIAEFAPYKTYNNNTPAYGKVDGYIEPFDSYIQVVANGILCSTYEKGKDGYFKGKILEVSKTPEGDLSLLVGSVEPSEEGIECGQAKVKSEPLPPVTVVNDNRSVAVGMPIVQADIDKMNALMRKHGLFVELGDDITMIADEYELKVATTGLGIMRGRLHPCSESVSVSVVSVPNKVYKAGSMFEAQVIRAVELATTKKLHLVARGACETTIPVEHETPIEECFLPVVINQTTNPEDYDIPEDSVYESEVGKLKTGETFTRKQWKDPRNHECAGCGNPIMFEDMNLVSMVSGYVFCPDCAEFDDETANGNVAEERLPWETAPTVNSIVKPTSSTGNIVSMYFACKECQRRLPHTRNQGGEVCDDCVKKYHNVASSVASSSGISTTSAGKTHKRLKNGFYVNQDIWNHMNCCKHCGHTIPWNYAESADMVGGAPVCITCTDLISNSIASK